MSESLSGKIRPGNRSDHGYAAIKSQHEVYYQMASIFRHVAGREDQLAKKILNRLFNDAIPEISLENTM